MGLPLFELRTKGTVSRRRELRSALVGVREAVAVIVVGVIAAATVLTGSLGGEAIARVERSVQSQWRPAYDLIVVPADVDLTQQVGGESVLQANFMSSLPNGITLRQWRDVKRLPGVDVAAPIANIGYFARSQNYYRIEGLTPGVYTVDRKVWWNSGIDRRLAGQSHSESQPARTDKCLEDPAVVVLDRNGGRIAREMAVERMVTGLATMLATWGEHPSEWQCRGLDPGGVFTVFGIDPVEEDRLLGLNESISGGMPLKRSAGLTDADYAILNKYGRFNVSDMPILLGDREWLDSDMRIRFSRWRTGPYELGDFAERATTTRCARRFYDANPLSYSYGVATDTSRCIDRQLQRVLASAPREHELTVDLPSPGGRSLVVGHYRNGEWRLKPVPGIEAARSWVASPSRQQYEAAGSDAPEGDWVGALRAVPSGSYGPEPTYREQVPSRRRPFLRYQQVGTYDPAVMAERFTDQSQWLPEGTYQVPRALARFDADGNQIAEPAQLRPTANPLGYLVQPPQALTTLKVARELVGRAPISAIRIRLSGVDQAGEESWQRIEDVVRRIREATGLQVLVMAGSSPARVLVELPGIAAADQPSDLQAWRTPSVNMHYAVAPAGPARTVDGFGWVEEPWLVEGASVRYLRASATSHLWLLGVVGTAALVYLAAAFTSLGLARIPTVAIRRAVGWTRLRVFTHELGRASLLGLAGAALGAGAGLLISRLAGLDLDNRLVAVAAPAAVLVCCLAALWPAWRVAGVPLAAALSGAEVAVTGGTGRRRGTKVQRVSTMAVVELWRLRTRALLAVVSGTVAVGAIVTLTSVRDQFAGSLQVTLLGQELLVATGPLQRAATGLAVALAVLMLAELLWQAVRDRRREIGMLRAVGWGRQHVIRLMIWQGVLLGVLAAVLGALTTTAILGATIAGTAGVLPLLGDTIGWATAAGLVLGATAAGIPAWAAARIPPADTLRTV